jgi:hypothetical protein
MSTDSDGDRLGFFEWSIGPGLVKRVGGLGGERFGFVADAARDLDVVRALLPVRSITVESP